MGEARLRTNVEQDTYLARIKVILSQIFRNKPCRIYLFGSRATGRHTSTSDFDIAVLAPEDVSSELSLARERMETSNIPLKVDLVDLKATSESFIQQIQEAGILIWKN